MKKSQIIASIAINENNFIDIEKNGKEIVIVLPKGAKANTLIKCIDEGIPGIIGPDIVFDVHTIIEHIKTDMYEDAKIIDTNNNFVLKVRKDRLNTDKQIITVRHKKNKDKGIGRLVGIQHHYNHYIYLIIWENEIELDYNDMYRANEFDVISVKNIN